MCTNVSFYRPLVAKRRGGQPEITNPASDQPSDDPTKPPAVVQPVGPAPAVVKAAESAKKEEETQKSSDTPVTDTDKPETKENSGSDNTTSNTENKPTMELAEPKEASKSAFPAFVCTMTWRSICTTNFHLRIFRHQVFRAHSHQDK